MEKIEKRLDPVYILNKLSELDKLKMVLLTKNQIKLFDYLPKPLIYFENEEEKKNNDD